MKDEAGIQFLTFSFDEKMGSINILDKMRGIPGGLIKTFKYIWIKKKTTLVETTRKGSW